MEDKLEIAKAKIEAGAVFNGTVYQKASGKSFTRFFIYLDNEMMNIATYNNIYNKETKAEIEAALCCIPKGETKPNNTWLVNEQKVTNSLSYGEMWNKYGTDFE